MQMKQGMTQSFDDMLIECVQTCADNYYQNASEETVNRKYEFFRKQLEMFRGYPDAVKSAFMAHLMSENSSFPKLSDIKLRIKIDRKPNYASGKYEYDGTWFSWLMTESVHDIKYFTHKVYGWEQEQVLKRLRSAGVKPEPLTNCKGYMTFKSFLDRINHDKRMGSFGHVDAFIGKSEMPMDRLKKLTNMVSEYDDSHISQEAEKYLEGVTA